MSIYKDGMMGLIVGDALGGPVQFMDRKKVQETCPITGMREVLPFGLPTGSWSDDSSMALATMASINEKGDIDYDDIMEKFISWLFEGKYTPFGKAFDVGNACGQSIYNYKKSRDISTCGLSGPYNNGNGSLMRILPVSIFCLNGVMTGKYAHGDSEPVTCVEIVGSLTHSHRISITACGFHHFITKKILLNRDKSIFECIKDGLTEAFDYYGKKDENKEVLEHFERLKNLYIFTSLPEDEISSSGYVIHTLEAAVWCLCNTDNLKDALLRAVNLADDSDSVGAVAGGFAGLYYGQDAIPKEWWEAVQNKELIESIVCYSI